MAAPMWWVVQPSMGTDPRPSATLLETARQHAGLSPAELWLRYVALGGTQSPQLLRRLLLGEDPLLELDYDLVALALNERLSDMDLDAPLPYSDEAD
jgi:hypothetical protein